MVKIVAIIRPLVLCFLILFSVGCNSSRDNLQKFTKLYTSCDYSGCIEFAKSKEIVRDKPSGDDLLWRLHDASIQRIVSNFTQSNLEFDAAEEMIKYYDLEFKGADVVATTAINDNALPYRGTSYDAIMVNVYKGINFMSLGKNDLARVEFNRALDRQRRAKERYNEQIAKRREELEKDKSLPTEAKKNANNSAIRKEIEEKYSNVFEFEAYPDFVNPFATYMAALFSLLDGDNSKAVDLFKETYGMAPDNKYLAKDLEIADTGLANSSNVWVIFENGLAPIKEEIRIDLPLVLGNNDIYYAGIALPMLKIRSKAFEHLNIRCNNEVFATETVSDMNRVVKTEFDREFDGILVRSIISATTKAIVQHELGRQSTIAAAVASIYTLATTTADVRVWTTLPSDFQIARVPMPKNKHLSIILANREVDVNIGDCKNAIVYIKMPTSSCEPIINVIKRD